jgi:predicted ATPase
VRLKSVLVQNFKCVRDSTPFKIDERVTALVGKNESGKTALLQAFAKLKPVFGADENFIDLDYPRSLWNEYKERSAEEPAEALTTHWQLEDDDIAALTEVLGPAASSTREIKISKGYDNERFYEVELDEAQVVSHLLSSHDLLEDEKASLKTAQTVQGLRSALAAIADPSQRQKALRDHIESTFAAKSADDVAIDILDERLPHVLYFSEYHRLPGQVSLDDLKARVQSKALEHTHRMFLALLGLIGRKPEEIEGIGEFERLIAELEAASSRLSREIFRYWSQNRHLRVRFRFDQARPGDPPPFNQGYVLRTRIENTRHDASTSFDDRSAGFVWFFSFLVWFSQVRKQYGENLVILLDEPGLSLHAKAQADLLRYIEERLAPKYQVIYTTHSPFMIDPSNLLRARTVEDVYIEEPDKDPVELGTRVGDDVLSTDRDTVFPLQAALGYEITQTLFVGEHTLLVEGPSDLLYLLWFRDKLAALDRTALDRRWTISPAGGIGKVAAFVALFGGNRLHVAVLTDFAHGQKGAVERLRASGLLRDGHVLTANAYADKGEADIEDLLGDEAYVDLVNQCYGLSEVHRLKPPGQEASNGRIVKHAEAHFALLPPEVDEFSHERPAEFLTRAGMEPNLNGLEAALDRFERLFKDANALL